MRRLLAVPGIALALLLALGGIFYFGARPRAAAHIPPTDGSGSVLVNGFRELAGETVAETVSYTIAEGKTTSGYLARPKGEGPFPAILLVHEWWGVNGNIREAARALAKEGYVALAADLFAGQTTADRAKALSLVQATSDTDALLNLRGALAYLEADTSVDARRIAVLGWCFGGNHAFRLGAEEADRLAAAVVYYGQITEDPRALAAYREPVLGIFGAEDATVPKDRVERFDAALTKIGAVHEIYIYPGAGHAFANPTNTAAYRPDAAADAWAKTLSFLEKHLLRKS